MNVVKITKSILSSLREKKLSVYFNKQWFDFREVHRAPVLSLFILEETLLDNKGNSYKQELSAHIEAFVASNNEDYIYHLVTDIKSALLIQQYPFSISYQGYEISLPDEGAHIVSARVKFKIVYFENIK